MLFDLNISTSGLGIPGLRPVACLKSKSTIMITAIRLLFDQIYRGVCRLLPPTLVNVLYMLFMSCSLLAPLFTFTKAFGPTPNFVKGLALGNFMMPYVCDFIEALYFDEIIANWRLPLFFQTIDGQRTPYYSIASRMGVVLNIILGIFWLWYSFDAYYSISLLGLQMDSYFQSLVIVLILVFLRFRISVVIQSTKFTMYGRIVQLSYFSSGLCIWFWTCVFDTSIWRLIKALIPLVGIETNPGPVDNPNQRAHVNARKNFMSKAETTKQQKAKATKISKFLTKERNRKIEDILREGNIAQGIANLNQAQSFFPALKLELGDETLSVLGKVVEILQSMGDPSKGNENASKFETIVEAAAKTMVGEAWIKITNALHNNKAKILAFCLRLVCGVLLLIVFANSTMDGKAKLALVSTMLVVSYLFADDELRTTVESFRDYLARPWAQSGGIDSSGYEGALTLVVATIMNVMSAMVEGKKLNWAKFVGENIKTWTQSREGMMDVCNMVKRGMQACVDFFMENIMGTKAFKLFNTTLPALDAWIDSSRSVLGDYITKTLLMRRETLLHVVDLKQQGYTLIEDLTKMKSFTHIYTIRSVINDLSSIQMELEAEGFFSSGVRPESVAICLNGSSGVGKSMSIKPLIHYILARILEGEVLERFLRDRDSAIFNRTIENVYWEGYNGQFVVLYDDFGQTLSANATSENEFMELIRAANNQPYHLHYASMLMKLEHYFTSKLIFMTTNIQDMEHTARNYVSCPEAVERRINVWVTVTIKKEFCTEETKNKSIRERRLDKTKIKKGFDHTTYEFYENKRQGGAVVLGRKYSFEELADKIISEYERCQLKDELVEQDINDLVAGALRDRGIDPSDYIGAKKYTGPIRDIHGTSQGGLVSSIKERVHEEIETRFHEVVNGNSSDTWSFDGLEFDPKPDFYDYMRNIKNWFFEKDNKLRDWFHDGHGGHIAFMKDKMNWDNTIDLSYGVEDKFSDTWETLEEQCYDTIRDIISTSWAVNKKEGMEKAFRAGIQILSGPLKLNRIELEALATLTFPTDWYQKWHCVVVDDWDRVVEFDNHVLDRLSDFTPIDNTIIRLICKVLACILLPRPVANNYAEYILVYNLAVELDMIYNRGCMNTNHTKHLLDIVKTRTTGQIAYFKEKYPVYYTCVVVMGSIAGIFGSYHIIKYIGTLFMPTPTPVPKEIHVITSEVTNEAQGADPMLKTVMDKILGKNLVAILHGPQLQCFAIFITGNEMIFPEHVRTSLLVKMGDKTRPLNIINPHDGEVLAGVLETDVMNARMYNSNVDLCIMTVSNIRRFPEVVNLFVDRPSVKDRQRGTVCMVQFDEGSQGNNTMMKVYMPFKRMNSVSYLDKNHRVWINHAAISYEGQTRSGDCGLPVFLVDPTTRCMKIIGMHIAGNPQDGLGFAAVITQDMLKIKATAQEGDERRMKFLTKISRPPGTNMKSSIRKSILYGQLAPVLTKPAHLRRFTRDGISIDPWVLAVAKYDKAPATIPDKYEFVMREAIRGVFNCVPRHDDLFREYTAEEVIRGVEGDKAFPSINRSTSAGYPYNTHPVPGKPGKTRFFGSGETIELDPNNRHWVELRDKIELQMSKTKRGLRQNFYYTGSLKDERRPVEKVEEGKTRYFAAAPIDLCIIVNQLFAGFKAYCYDNKLKNPMCIGLNPYSLDWHNMATQLLLMSKSVFGLDYKGFDSSQKLSVLMWMGKYLIEAMGSKDEVLKARMTIWLEFANSKHVLRDEIYEWFGCNPSGNPMTTIINTIYGIFLLLFTWQILVVETVDTITLNDFWELVVAKITGDDNICSVSDRIKHIYNRRAIIECLAEYGIEATDEHKSHGTIEAYNDITEVSYLKRSFRYDTDHNRWVAPLAMDTILEIPSWTKKGAQQETIPITNLELVLRELTLHGKPVFNTYLPQITSMLLNNYGYVPKTTSYDELLTEVLDADMRDYTHKFQKVTYSAFLEEGLAEWDDPTLLYM